MSTDQSPENHSPAYKIFHYYVDVQIPASFAYERHFEEVGTPVYTNPAMEEQAAAEMVFRRHTVAELIEYYRRGATIIFTDVNQSVDAYGWLRDHLNQMREKSGTRVNTGNIPLSDLQAMDEFASMLYRIARRYEQVDETSGKMSRQMDRLFGSRMRKRRLTEAEQAQEAKKPEEDATPREHPNMADDIRQSTLDRKLPYQ